MARSSLALCVVLAMSGCGAVASRTSETTDDLLVRAVPGDGDVLGAPSGVEVPSQRMTSLLPPKAFGLGYFWIGYAATDTGGPLFAAMFFFAIGEAFRTGTHKAMIFTWLRNRNRTDEKTEVYGYTRSWSKLGSAVSVVLSAGIQVLIVESVRRSELSRTIPLLSFTPVATAISGARERGISSTRRADAQNSDFSSVIAKRIYTKKSRPRVGGGFLQKTCLLGSRSAEPALLLYGPHLVDERLLERAALHVMDHPVMEALGLADRPTMLMGTDQLKERTVTICYGLKTLFVQ